VYIRREIVYEERLYTQKKKKNAQRTQNIHTSPPTLAARLVMMHALAARRFAERAEPPLKLWGVVRIGIRCQDDMKTKGGGRTKGGGPREGRGGQDEGGRRSAETGSSVSSTPACLHDMTGSWANG
jgi:hypothetical protein